MNPYLWGGSDIFATKLRSLEIRAPKVDGMDTTQVLFHPKLSPGHFCSLTFYRSGFPPPNFLLLQKVRSHLNGIPDEIRFYL
jgi:hypothetical protein